MPPVRRKVKAVVMVDPTDIGWLAIGPPPRLDHGPTGGPWRRIWAKRWPAEGAALMDALPQYSFDWAIATWGDPRRRCSTPKKETATDDDALAPKPEGDTE